jgi:hypothetical protein
MRKLFVIATVGALVVFAASCKFVVTPQAPNNWSFLTEGANARGTFVNGPGTPPVGRGSALLSIDSTGRESIATTSFAGIAVASIRPLRYSTYQAFSNVANAVPSLTFDVDYDLNDSSTDYQGRLVYDPSIVGGVLSRAWQTWDAESGAAAWYSSGSGTSEYRPIVGDVPQTDPPCTQATPCTWNQLLTLYPKARVLPAQASSPGLFLVGVGPVTGGFVGAVDNVVFGVNGTPGEFNFEPGDSHITVDSASAGPLGFRFATETVAATGSFVSGPNGADGAGSAQFTLNSTGAEAFGGTVYAGTRFDHLRFLSYKTYEKAAGVNATTLQLDADYDRTGNTTTAQGRLVFEPRLAGGQAVTNETWQTWNPLTTASGW